ncbi:hypothetical protein LZ30DRAFT_537309, partial [Colletotrichum cereale]
QHRRQEQETRQQMLNPEAADRLGRTRPVKASRTVAQGGQLRSKVTEAQLKELLSAVNQHNQ